VICSLFLRLVRDSFLSIARYMRPPTPSDTTSRRDHLNMVLTIRWRLASWTAVLVMRAALFWLRVPCFRYSLLGA